MNTKPHLRLHYRPVTQFAMRTEPNKYPWVVEYVRGPSRRVRKETYQHADSAGALNSARVIWWGV